MTLPSPGEPPHGAEERGAGRPLPWGPDAPLDDEPEIELNPEPEYDGRYGTPGMRWRGDGSVAAAAAAAAAATATRRLPGYRDFDRDPFMEQLRQGEAPGIAGRAYASFGRRLGAWLIDLVIRVVLLWIVLAITGIDAPEDPLVVSSPLFGAMQSLNLMYSWIFVAQGWTPGMRILGLRVVREDGVTAPGPWWAIVRTLGALLSELAFFIGYVWMLRDARRQTWHDKMARTFVVVAREEDYDGRKSRDRDGGNQGGRQ